MTDLLAMTPQDQDLLFREARTANAFTDEPVTEDQVRAIYDLVKWAPTALNAQPLRVLLVPQGEQRERLLRHMAPGNRAKTAGAPLVAVLAADTSFHDQLPRVFPHAPAVRDGFAADEARRVETARFNATLQAGYFLLGVRAAGLAAGPMGGYDAQGIDDDLLAGTGWRSVLVVNLGHPSEDAWLDRLPRLDYDEVVRSLPADGQSEERTAA
jgi:3-hydroxypropanoate dehydrogenase